MAASHIELRGVEVHNLKQVDLDIPHHKLVVICGVSGSGKTSLALDTLYAEGQRRYIESFSAYTRQFLERLDKPAAERIEGIPPSIAVTHQSPTRSSRATVGTATETVDYLRLLFAKIGKTYCQRCGKTVRRDTPDSVARTLGSLAQGVRYMVTFPIQFSDAADGADLAARLQEDGFVRVLAGTTTVHLADGDSINLPEFGDGLPLHVVVDRLTGGTDERRVRDSLEIAFSQGEGRCHLFVDAEAARQNELLSKRNGHVQQIDGRSWSWVGYNTRLACEDCGISYPTPTPKLFSFNSPLGACPECEGFGNLIDIDMDLVVPDPRRSLRDGAIAPWNSPAYAHELQELLALAGDYDLPVDVPYRQLEPRHLQLIQDGVPERDFGGLKGFFAWLEKRKYKMHLRVFLSRWRSYRTCPVCEGTRLRTESLATRVGEQNIAEICQLKIDEAAQLFHELGLSERERSVGQVMLEQIESRLRYLQEVGLSYLTLDRPLRTLSGGEAQRVALTSALGSSLVNMLYVLDEPSVGLHPRDTGQLLNALGSLRDRGNSVVVVEHEEAILRAADHLIEIGPGAGESGGRVVFQGSPQAMAADETSLTGDYLAGRRGAITPQQRRKPNHGWIRLAGARGNNLDNVTVEFPLGVLCVVTGVSGSGKSTLIEHTLSPALRRRKRQEAPKPLPHDDVFGDGQIDEVILVDQSPISRSPRSNPVTYIKAFDAIRAVFAETVDARTHNYTAGHFSFNVDGGRCTACGGDGFVRIDMQFLADVYMKCSQCGGRRYRKEILDVHYRGRSIAEVLDMTVRQAYSFFRGQDKVQERLRRLIDVGLDYLRLGQPATNLSAGEAQRLKLASYLATSRRLRTLFLMDEPTTGLHFSDVVNLLDCMEALLSAGHSLIVVEHNLQIMKAADYIVDLGPGAAEEGGRIVAQGTPEAVAEEPASLTGRWLAEALKPRTEED